MQILAHFSVYSSLPEITGFFGSWMWKIQCLCGFAARTKLAGTDTKLTDPDTHFIKLEISLWETTRGFESLPLRHINKGRNLALKKEAAKCRPLFYTTNTVQRLLFTACHPLPKGWLKKKKTGKSFCQNSCKAFFEPGGPIFNRYLFCSVYPEKDKP